MCALKMDGVNRIHLEAESGLTLCGLLSTTVERDVRTGWPDCNDCIGKSEKKAAA